jgi:hypothetical protein
MATAQDIIERLGGMAAVARKLKLPLTTVQGWQVANHFPDWRKEALIRLAMDEGKPLSTEEFPTVDERIPRKPRAA